MSSNLAISLVIGASVGAAISGINQVKSAFKALTDSSKSATERVASLSALSVAGMKSSIAGLTALGSSIVGLATPAMQFESAMADVKKVVDFKTPEGFKNLSKQLLDLTDTIPMTANELAAIAASGGQLGVAEEDLKSFTTTISKMSVAFDMSAERSGEAMAKLANVYKIPIAEIGKLGDAINHLSNSSPAKANEIVEVLGRVGGVANDFGLAENSAAALAGTFISLGKTPEVASTAINGMLTTLNTADKGGKKFQAALKEVGISAKTLKANIAKNGEAALVDFLKRVEKLPKAKRTGILVDLFGKEYADDVASVAGNVDLLEKSLKSLQEVDENGNLKYLGSMEKEFAARSKTTEASLTKLKNSFMKLGISIGQYILPVINEFVGWLQPIVISIADWVGTNTALMESIAKWGTYIIGGIAGFTAFMGVLSGITFIALKAFLVFKTLWTVISFVSQVVLGMGKILVSIVGIMAKVLVTGVLKLAYGFGYLIGIISKMAIFALNLGKILAGALFKGLLMVGKAIVMMGRVLLMNPIGLLITGIAVAAYLIYQYWEPIKAFFINLWATIKPYFERFYTFAKNLWNNIVGIWETVWHGIINFFSNLWTEITTAFDGGLLGIGNLILNWSPINLFHQAFAAVLSWFGIDIPNNFSIFASQALQSFTNWVVNWDILGAFQGVFNQVFEWFSNLPSRFAQYGSNIVDGIKNGVSGFTDRAKDSVVSFADSVSGWFTKKLKIHSPSRVFKGYGVNVVEGLVIGMDKAQPLATEASQHLSNAVTFEPVLNTVETMFKPTLIKEKGFFGSLWDDIQFGANMVGNLLGLNQPTDLRTPSFNPQAKDSGLFADYQPLNRNEVSNTATTHNQGITVHFSPNITITGSAPAPDLKEQLLQALNDPAMLYGLEQLLNRVNDQFGRRAY
ncbi:phage tail tape measure protein [Pasteurella multocida]|uniref:phage tail tape measure protein n=1 Tax=Pasteurella multocida TaxID=747 RepID=UPI00147A3DE3|nr:phage tail tape measure protein [Pasteurella multocida]NNI07734.1 phage tail tape measure protein [Pasteurella multocida]NNI33476.1 phage tail tape measure protein [Pasteurella multocida]